MTGWLIFPGGNPVAVARQEELTRARIKEEYKNGDGEDTYPDNITSQAVDVIDHPSNGQSAMYIGDEAIHLLTTGEVNQLRDKDFMIAAGWFPDE